MNSKYLILLHILGALSIALTLSMAHWALGAAYVVIASVATWVAWPAIKDALALYDDLRTKMQKTE